MGANSTIFCPTVSGTRSLFLISVHSVHVVNDGASTTAGRFRLTTPLPLTF